MTATRIIAGSTAALVLAGAGVATADAPVVTAQKSSVARTAPVTIPGTGLSKASACRRGRASSTAM